MSDQNTSSPFLNVNAEKLAAIYALYTQDPSQVTPEWRKVFLNLDQEAKSFLNNIAPQGPAVRQAPEVATSTALLDATRVAMLIHSFQVRGHLIAKLDPLNLEKKHYIAELDPFTYGFTEEDFGREMFLGGALGMQSATLAEIYQRLQEIHTGPIGMEYMHIQEAEQRDWIQKQIENVEARKNFSQEEKITMLDNLIKADQFEKYLQTKFPGAKRFSLEGGESFIPALEQILLQGNKLGIQEFALGMAHRGRLNTIVNVMHKPFRSIVSEFEGIIYSPEDFQGSGDVKYHLGASNDREINGTKMHLSLTANPSHLEAVNPVIVGKVRAKQKYNEDEDRTKVVGILVHGDAAMAGQGIVGETLIMSELPGYRVGGTIHLVINNQIGFTTSPGHSRSSPYCSDIVKTIQAPIFHVNGDDVEAVAYACHLAVQFRQKFKKDVVIDIFCYRRWGHNEMDEPSFTQPLMYAAIAKQVPVKDKYRKKLIAEGTITEEKANELAQNYEDYLKTEFDAASNYKPKKADWLDGVWTGFEVGNETNLDGDSMASMEALKEVAQALTKVPEGFEVHKRLDRILKDKEKRLQEEKDIDWATAEALAFGTLLLEGSPVRLSGQDSQRGTFSQRHGVFVDQKTEKDYIPLNHIKEGQAELEILNSPLSEMGVLGFEYGYSLANPNELILWEAQFGDFANNAQTITDQFISAGEEKWYRMSGLVLLLPHAYEGQGPEHSSARLERYLQLSAQNNWQVVNCTTPANYFHVLRRQLRRKIRIPLVIMTPKGLLRHKLAVSTFKDMGPGTSFKRVIDEEDKAVKKNKVKRILLCSGKLYYELLMEREERKLHDIAIIRVEQLYPFPEKSLTKVLKNYNKSAPLFWVQEEPENMGSWTYIDRRLEKVMTDLKMKVGRPQYIGRPASAATATGYAKRHEQMQKELIDRALTID